MSKVAILDVLTMHLIHKPGEAHEGAATRATRVAKTTGGTEQEQANEQKETHKQEHKHSNTLAVG